MVALGVMLALLALAVLAGSAALARETWSDRGPWWRNIAGTLPLAGSLALLAFLLWWWL